MAITLQTVMPVATMAGMKASVIMTMKAVIIAVVVAVAAIIIFCCCSSVCYCCRCCCGQLVGLINWYGRETP